MAEPFRPAPPTLAERAASWLALPVLMVMAAGVRRRSFRMPPASGPVTGRVPGAEPALRLLVIGDSSAAGVGVAHTREGLAAHVATEMARLSGQAVAWRMAGANSATAASLRDHVLPHVEPRDFTHVLVCVGTNDAKNYHTGNRFCRAFGGLAYALRTRFPDARIVWSPPIDMRDMPVLPPFLARMAHVRGRRITANGAQLCFERGLVAAAPLPVHDVAGFAADGFHANAVGCGHWAVHVAPMLLAEVADSTKA
jgi:lysophospholipase L1-like esterase